MSKTITLPVSGATVVLREVSTFKQGERKKVYAGAADIEDKMLGGWKIVENMLGLLIESWTLDLMVPSIRPESLDDLEAADFDTLQEEAQTAMDLLWPKLAKSLETMADPKAPTDNSKA
jgi:hypothetical protein